MLATCSKSFERIFHGSYMRITPQHVSRHVQDTCMNILGINQCMFYMLVTCRKCFRINNVLFKFSSYKTGVSMNSWFLVTARIYFKKKVFKYI